MPAVHDQVPTAAAGPGLAQPPSPRAAEPTTAQPGATQPTTAAPAAEPRDLRSVVQTAEVVRMAVCLPVGGPRAAAAGELPAAELLTALGAGWRPRRRREDVDLQGYGDEVLRQLLARMPHVVVATDDLPAAAGAPRLAAPAGNGRWRLSGSSLSLWSTGVGLLVLTYELEDLRVPWSAVLDDARTLPRDVLPAATALVATALQGLAGRGDSTVMWGNAVLLVTSAPGLDGDERTALAHVLTPVGTDVVDPDGPCAGVVRVGLNSCAVSRDDERLADALVRLAGAHQTCWAVALQHEAALGDETRELDPAGCTLSLEQLEARSGRILRRWFAAQSFVLGYRSVQMHLEPRDVLLWHALETEWDLPPVLQSMDDHVRFLRELHGQLSAQVQSRHSARLNELVLAFTFLSIFGILLAAMTFAALTPFDVQAVTVAATLAALGITVLGYVGYRAHASR